MQRAHVIHFKSKVRKGNRWRFIDIQEILGVRERREISHFNKTDLKKKNN